MGKSFEYKGGLAYENYYYCLGYLTQSPIKTLAQETFLEGVKFEDLEYDGVGGYSYKTTLFGEEIEYIFEFKFGNLYRMQCGFFIAYDIGVTDVYDYSSYANPVDKKLD